MKIDPDVFMLLLFHALPGLWSKEKPGKLSIFSTTRDWAKVFKLDCLNCHINVSK